VILSDGDTIHPTHLRLSTDVLALVPESPLANLDMAGTLADVMSRATEAVERETIAKALQDANGDTARAADRLQIGFKTLTVKMRQYGLTS
jgi:DNA-binding NtrC family response regulator